MFHYMTYLSSTAAAVTAAVTTAVTTAMTTAATMTTTATTAAAITAAIITTAATFYHDGEGEVDARRYIHVRGIYDHWRRIDVKPEGRRDGYTADH